MPPPTVIINLHGGIVQDVFCSLAEVDVRLVDWDVEGSDQDDPGIVEVALAEDRKRFVFVGGMLANPLDDLAGTDVERALKAAEVQDGQS